MNTHVTAPPLDLAEPVEAPEIVTADKPAQDWEQLVSPGHVLRARLLARGGRKTTLAGIAALAAFAVAILGPAVVDVRVPPQAFAMLQVDPDTFTHFPDGTRTSYRLNWLAGLPAQAGLTAADWSELVAAVQVDVARYGTEAASYEALQAVEPTPRITRPAKTFEAQAMDRLSTGVVAIPGPGQGNAVDVIAFVDGRLAWSVVAAGRCAVFIGPAVEGCTSASFAEPGVVRHVVDFKPEPVK